MAAGDPYFTCDKINLGIEQVFRDMVYDDGDGNPVLTLNTNTVLEQWFNCAERKNVSTEQVIRKMIVQDSNGKPQLNISNL